VRRHPGEVFVNRKECGLPRHRKSGDQAVNGGGWHTPASTRVRNPGSRDMIRRLREDKRKTVHDRFQSGKLGVASHARKQFLKNNPRNRHRCILDEHPAEGRHGQWVWLLLSAMPECQRKDRRIQENHRRFRAFL
jgi:hypothetical protein